MRIKIQKWGNSLAIRIPKAFAKETNIENGSFVDLRIENQHMVIDPIENRQQYDLNSMLQNINESNIHAEIDFGEPVGQEIM